MENNFPTMQKLVQTIEFSAPWYVYQNKLKSLFELDNDVTVGPVLTSEDGPSVTLEVASHSKAAALKKLVQSPTFGNVTLNIVIEDTETEETEADTLRAAFAYNRLVRSVETFTDVTGTDHTYLVIEPSVAQFYADNLADYHGNLTILAEDAARDVLTLRNTVVCTADLQEN